MTIRYERFKRFYTQPRFDIDLYLFTIHKSYCYSLYLGRIRGSWRCCSRWWRRDLLEFVYSPPLFFLFLRSLSFFAFVFVLFSLITPPDSYLVLQIRRLRLLYDPWVVIFFLIPSILLIKNFFFEMSKDEFFFFWSFVDTKARNWKTHVCSSIHHSDLRIQDI